jgi:hypothetical protein
MGWAWSSRRAGPTTAAARAGVPLRVLRDTIQPFPTFSDAFLNALQALEA